MQILIYLVFVQCFAYHVLAQQDQGQGSYKAAVVEYAPLLAGSTPEARLLENMKEYRLLMETAADKGVQIIVFPEDGLTGWEDVNDNTVHELSTEVPDPISQISPCSNQNANYSKYFIDLSCAAQTFSIYTVLNLIEREYDNKTSKMIYHNTNIVFDKSGGVIARYRKVNLFDEPDFVPGNDIVTFKTDFGVTFGMFICFDILFKKPALDVLADPAVTDVVYSTAWFSELPFYGAVSIQDGYAKSNGVNLLASGLDDPVKRNGGSGIYLASGSIAESYISGVRASKMIIQDVPKISARTSSDSCQISNAPAPRSLWGLGGGRFPNISSFRTGVENTVNYTFKALNLDNNVIMESICSGDSLFCCSFNITVNKHSSVQANYVYKLLAYYGVSPVGTNKTLGLSNCALVACLNDTNSSCGGRYNQAPQGVTFESVSVKSSFNPKMAHFQPATIKYNLQPISDYTYCTKTIINDMVEVQIATTQPQDSLLTFGIHGRVFDNDDKPGGKSGSATFLSIDTFVVFIISVFIFLLQD